MLNAGGSPNGGDHLLNVARSSVHGESVFRVNGSTIVTLASNAPTDVWGLDNSDYLGDFNASAIVSVVSNNAADNPVGIGAHTIRIYGLKEVTSTEIESEDIATNGTTKVQSSSSWYRVIKSEVIEAGSGEENEGVITVVRDSDDRPASIIPPRKNVSLDAVFTVPDGKTAYLVGEHYHMANNASQNAVLDVTLTSNTTTGDGGVFIPKRMVYLSPGQNYSAKPAIPFSFRSREDIKVRIDRAEGDNSFISCDLEFLLVNN